MFRRIATIAIGMLTVIIMISMVHAPPAFASYEDSLVGYWNMNNDWTDQSGTGNNPTNNGAVTFDSSGRFGQAVSFNGSNSLYVLSPSSLPAGASARTLTAWFKFSGAGSYSAVLGYGGNNPNGIRSELWIDRGNRVGVELCNGANLVSYTNDNNWHMLTAVLPDNSTDSSDFKIYVDGVLMPTVYVMLSAVNTAAGPLTIGNMPTYGGYFFNGKVDDAAIWNRALSDDEVLQVKNFGVQAFEYLSVDMGYDTIEMASLYNIYSQQSGTVTLDGTQWQYTSASLDGHNTGDAWTEDGKYYIKLGSGLEGGPSGGVPEPATIFTILGGLAMAAYRRVCKRVKKG